LLWPSKLLSEFSGKLFLQSSGRAPTTEELHQFSQASKKPQKLQLAMAYLLISVALYNNSEDTLGIASSILPHSVWFPLLTQLRTHAEIKYPDFREALGIISISGGKQRAKVGDVKKWDTWPIILGRFPCIQQDQKFADILLFLERKSSEFDELIAEPSNESEDGMVA
jgi:hypothetical protein